MPTVLIADQPTNLTLTDSLATTHRGRWDTILLTLTLVQWHRGSSVASWMGHRMRRPLRLLVGGLVRGLLTLMLQRHRGHQGHVHPPPRPWQLLGRVDHNAQMAPMFEWTACVAYGVDRPRTSRGMSRTTTWWRPEHRSMMQTYCGAVASGAPSATRRSPTTTERRG